MHDISSVYRYCSLRGSGISKCMKQNVQRNYLGKKPPHFKHIHLKPIVLNMSSAEEGQEINPLQKKLSPAQFDASVKFYEADHELESSDRSEIAHDLQSIVTMTSTAGYGAGMVGFFAPTIYSKYVKRINLPAGRFLYKPFLSFLVGLSTMLVAHQGVARVQFNSQISKLEAQASTKPKQLQVWKSMDYHQAGLFYLYFRQSSTDPSFILKDPRTIKEHEVTVHPSMKHLEEGDFVGSLWNKIREENGIEPVEERDAPDGSTGKTAWDRLREKK